MSFNYLNLQNEKKSNFQNDMINVLSTVSSNKIELENFLEDIWYKVRNMDSKDFKNIIESDKEVSNRSNNILEKKLKKKKEIEEIDDPATNLSLDIIVYCILPYHLLSTKTITGEYELFGKKNRYTGIWFLFTSLLFDERKSSFFVSLEKIKYLGCLNYNSISSLFFYQKNNFQNLEELLCIFTEISDTQMISWYGIDATLSKQIDIASIMKLNKFNKLKSLYTDGCASSTLIDSGEMRINSLSLKGLIYLSISENKFSLYDTQSLHTLILDNVYFSGYEEWDMLANVKILQLKDISFRNEDCGNVYNFIQIHKFEKLEVLCLFGLDKKILGVQTEKTSNWDSLLDLKINLCDITDDFFKSNSFGKLKYIDFVRLNLITGNKWNIFPSLKSFNLEECNNFDHSFLQPKNMKNIEQIHCINCMKIRGTHKSIVQNLSYKEKLGKLEIGKENVKSSLKKMLNDYSILYKEKEKDYFCNLDIENVKIYNLLHHIN